MSNVNEIISTVRNFALAIMRDVDPSDKYDKVNVSKTRAELSLNLQQFGIENDASYISSYVYSAYLQAKNEDEAEKIYLAFVSNDRSRYLVEEFQVKNSLLNQDTGGVIDYLTEKSSNGVKDTEKAKRTISNLTKYLREDVQRAAVSLTGAGGAKVIQKQAGTLFNKYTSLIEYYQTCESDVKNAIYDFTMLRSEILTVYRYLSTTLINCFGDSIKVIAPEIFDFDAVEWLDTASMLKQAGLKYDQLSDTCGNLINAISENFSNSVRGAIDAYRVVGDKRMGLIMAGLTMLNHYVDSYSQTAVLGKEYLTFKNYLNHDITTIKADLSRIAAIYKLINDLYLPRANAFFKHQDKVLNKEFTDLTEILYKDKKVKKLREEQKELIEKCQNTEEFIIDLQKNISYYQNTIDECHQTLAKNKEEYNRAKMRKPQKPFWLVNVLTFGRAKSSYNRDLTEWAWVCKPVIDSYEELLVEVEIDRKELSRCKSEHKDLLKQLDATKKSINKIADKIKTIISVDDDMKKQIAPHLKDIVLLLKIAKNIISSGLSENLVKKVTIDKIELEELTEQEKANIEKYTKAICDDFKEEPIVVKKENEVLSAEDQELNVMINSYNHTIDNFVTMIQSSIDLYNMYQQQKVASQEYEKRLSEIQNEFQSEMEKIDDQSGVLRSALAQINTADNLEATKQGLIALVENVDISDEIKGFLNGNNTLTI